MASLIARSAVRTARASATARAMSTFSVRDFKGHKLDSLPSTEVESTGEELIGMLEMMMTIRRMETAAGEAYRAKKIRGFCHLYSGQEAICVGMKAGLQEGDDIISAYRIHGWGLMMGMSVENVLGELFGNNTGCSRGKGGSMHMYAPHFYGGNGIVGAQVPVGAGVAFANQYLDKGTVCVSLYGDGASNQGQNFEAYNIAKLWDLPAIFVCENNKYGMGTSAERSSASTDYYTRGDYVPGIWVDAMDVLAVKQATEYARDHALNKGPIVMEMETYRYHGHSMSDPDSTYRTKDEKAHMRKTEDCILKVKEKLVDIGFSTEAELKALEKDVRKHVAAEQAKAEAAGPPPDSLLVDHILDGEKVTARGCDITLEHAQL